MARTAQRPVAGPSKLSNSINASDDDDVEMVSGEDTDVVEVAPPKGKAKVNGAVAKKPDSGARKPARTRAGEEGGGEGDVQDDAGAARRKVAAPASKSKAVVPAGKQRSTDPEALWRQIDRLRAELEEVSKERDKAEAQVDELLSIRHTEPEEALKRQAANYEARLHTQEELLKELTSQPDAHTKGNVTPGAVHFLSREAADEEKAQLVRELTKCKEALAAKDREQTAKEHELSEKEHAKDQEIQKLQMELKAEIEHSKGLAAKAAPGPVSRARHKHGPSALEDSKNGAVIRFYEELTNLLVVNMRWEESAPENSSFKLDEPIYQCIYTPPDATDSLTFNLWFYYEVPPEHSGRVTKEDMVRQVRYSPLELDKISAEFEAKLDFLASPFTFADEQTSVFLKTLRERLGNEEVIEEGMTEDEVDTSIEQL